MNLTKFFVLNVLLYGISASVNAATETGSVSITGNILDSTCEVPAAQLTRTIMLPEINQSTLSSVANNAVVSGVSQTFQFDVNCPAAT
ncbi:hypothetical protein L0B67_005089, partial [Salmonella enterica]|nr:hypothetical protein [Salmonella enterica]EIS6494451.1 hypothetical protein [Salmonella enterica]